MNKKSKTTSTTLPPFNGAPDVPPVYKPVTREEVLRMHKPIGAQATEAGALATELVVSKTYARDFGPRAASAETLAGAIAEATTWLREDDRATAWAAYATSERLRTWDTTMRLLNEFEKELSYAVDHDPSIAQRYPHAVAFFAERKVVAARGLATRRAKKKTPAAKTAPTAATG